MSEKTFINNGVMYTEKDMANLGMKWKESVCKAVRKYVSDPACETEVLDDLLNDYAADKFTLDPAKNINGFIYRAAENRAKNLRRKIARCKDVNCGVEDLGRYSDEDGKSPAERMMWNAREKLMDSGFQELEQVLQNNGHVRDPKKSVAILKAFLQGETLNKLAERFHLEDKNYPSLLKHRYLPVLQDIIIRKAAV